MRFYGRADNGRFIVDEDAPHMTKTLRMRPGDAFTGIDGSGIDYACVIESAEDRVLARVEWTCQCLADPAVPVTLYQAYPKAAKVETIVQKCVELGLSALYPFLSERCVKRPKSADSQRLNRVAREAVKQCGRSKDVAIGPLLSFEDVCGRVSSHELTLFFYEGEDVAHTLKSALSPAGDIGIIIGSEGGFTPGEAAAFKAAGARPVSLGRRILRAETAGMAALAMVMYGVDGL